MNPDVERAVERAMRPPHDADHRPYEVCYRVDWWNHGVASDERIAEAIARVGEQNVRVVGKHHVLWVWECSGVSSIRWLRGSPFEEADGSPPATVEDAPLDRAWRAVDALGGTWPDPVDERDAGFQAGYDEALDKACAAIEKLGGHDVRGREGEDNR